MIVIKDKLKSSNLKKYIVCTSAIYLALLPIGLPHLMFCLSILLLYYDSIYKKIDTPSFIWLAILTLLGLFYLSRGSDWKTTFNNVSSMLMYPITIILLKKYRKEDLIKLSILFIKCTIIIFSIECLIRYGWSIISPKAAGIYRFKFHSVIFQDTNFLGLALLVVIFLIKYLRIFQGITNLNNLYKAGILLLFLSISRAAILGWIIGEIVFHKLNSNNFKSKSLFRILLLTVIGIILGTVLYNMLYEDPSFKSKLYILDLAEDVLDSYKKYRLFGIGYGNAEDSLGIFPHNYILLYYLELGIVGLAIKVLFLLYILFTSKFQCLIVLLPYSVAVMSATGYGSHYLFLVFALITLLSKSTNSSTLLNENFGSYSGLQR